MEIGLYLLTIHWGGVIGVVGVFIFFIGLIVYFNRKDQRTAQTFLNTYANQAQVVLRGIAFTKEIYTGNKSSRIAKNSADFYFFEQDVVVVAKADASPWNYCFAIRTKHQPEVVRPDCPMESTVIQKFHVAINPNYAVKIYYRAEMLQLRALPRFLFSPYG